MNVSIGSIPGSGTIGSKGMGIFNSGLIVKVLSNSQGR